MPLRCGGSLTASKIADAQAALGIAPVARLEVQGAFIGDGREWDEVWIDNRWVPLDATLGQGGIGAHFYHVLFSNIVFESDGSFTAVGAGLLKL